MEINPTRQRTQVDEGWVAQNIQSTRQPTLEDPGWGPKLDEMVNGGQTEDSLVVNAFPSLSKFMDAVEKLKELKSSSNKIYSINGTISREGGEAIALLCSDSNGEKCAAKVYYKAINSEDASITEHTPVLDYMQTEEGKKYTLAISDIGVVMFGESKYYFEIMPYCDGGDLSDKGAFSFSQIETITKQLNEALHSMHMSGIIHRDIKPENLYLIDGRYKIGDFGIAKKGYEEGIKFTVTQKYTIGYAGPETSLGAFGIKSDYYSLGITLASLYEGHFVFDGMNRETMVTAQMNEKIPLKKQDPHREQFENLLKGLCRIDPNRRYGYEDVKHWLDDHYYIGGEEVKGKWPRPFGVFSESYNDEKSLFFGLTKDKEHWDEAKAMLFNKDIEAFFRNAGDTRLSRMAQKVDEMYRTDNPNKGLFVFLKALYPPGPIVWVGHTFNSLGELGSSMVRTKTPGGYGKLLQNKIVSYWLNNTEGIKVDDETKETVDKIEELSLTRPEESCYWFGNVYAPKKMITINENTVSTIEELMKALFSAPSNFYQNDGYEILMDRGKGANLYGFLDSFGYKEIIDKWWEKLNLKDPFHKLTLLFSLLDSITDKAGSNPKIVRSFYCKYGPIGMAIYAKSLVDNDTYTSLDHDSKLIIDDIKRFNVSTSGSIDDIFSACFPLVEKIEKLRKTVMDNPYSIMAGTYNNQGAICKNLKGCFAFKIFGRYAPLGFEALLESI